MHIDHPSAKRQPQTGFEARVTEDKAIKRKLKDCQANDDDYSYRLNDLRNERVAWRDTDEQDHYDDRQRIEDYRSSVAAVTSSSRQRRSEEKKRSNQRANDGW